MIKFLLFLLTLSGREFLSLWRRVTRFEIESNFPPRKKLRKKVEEKKATLAVSGAEHEKLCLFGTQKNVNLTRPDRGKV